VHTVSTHWFRHDAHGSVEQFVCSLPLACFRFEAHDQYTNVTRYEMATLFGVFVLKNLHGWEHETALIECIKCRLTLCEQLGVDSVWRAVDLLVSVEVTVNTNTHPP